MAKTTPSKIPWLNSKGKYTESTDWQSMWPELRVNEVDPIEVVADFYLTEGLQYHGYIKGFDELPEPVDTPGIIVGPRVYELAKILRFADTNLAIKEREERVKHLLGGFAPSNTKGILAAIAEEARIYQRELVEAVVPTFWAYGHAACGGELRHHPSVRGHYMSHNRKAAWVQWRSIYQEYGADALKWMSKLFREMSGGGIGGEAWAQVSDTLLKHHEGKLGPDEYTNDKMFLDRIVSLQHNNGCLFSKRTWVNHRMGNTEKCKGYSAQNLKPSGTSMVPVLDAHADDPTDVEGLFACASPKVRDMTIRYFDTIADGECEPIVSWDFSLLRSVHADGWQVSNKTTEPYGIPYWITPADALPEPKTSLVQPPTLAGANLSPVAGTGTMIANVLMGSKLTLNIIVTKVIDEHGNYKDCYHVTNYKFKDVAEFKAKKFYFAHLSKGVAPKSHIREMKFRIQSSVGSTEWYEYTGTSFPKGKNKLGSWFINKF